MTNTLSPLTHSRGAWFALLITSSLLCLAARAEEDQAPAAGNNAAPAKSANRDDPLNMDLDQLTKADVVVPSFDVPVNSVTRQESTVGRTPAAVFVITQDMIRRSGAQEVPELLRMVPGIQVAKINSNTWAVTARGFNDRFADKLLVMIDRRIVYNATFGGTYWDTQDLLLQDVERIEVIRGPGATVWGANAVNGVISIYTKRAKDTQGGLISTGGGTYERNWENIRYGGKNGDVEWRVWARQFDRAPNYLKGQSAGDGWHQGHGGFRCDWTPAKDDQITVQGDLYSGESGQLTQTAFATPPFAGVVQNTQFVNGLNTLLRWNHQVDEDENWQFWTYYDQYGRDAQIFTDRRKTWDIDYQYSFRLAERHKVIAGANYRLSGDNEVGGFAQQILPPRFTTQWASAFIQDEITLVDDRLYFIAGTKLEQNTFGGFQPQPSLRLMYTPSERRTIWTSVSRAVRMPNRADANAIVNVPLAPMIPTFVHFIGVPTLPEDLLAYEIGYRAQPTDTFSWDIATFVNRYQHLISTATGTPFMSGPYLFIPTTPVSNGPGTSGITYGAELTSTWKVNDKWQLMGSYTFFRTQAESPNNGPNPKNQLYVRSSWDLPRNVQLDLIGRYVDRLSSINVPQYIMMDARIAWQRTKNMEIALVGQNLLARHHLEFVDNMFGGLVATQVPMGAYLTATWTH